MATKPTKRDATPAPTTLRAPAAEITCAADEGLKPSSKTWNQVATAGAFKGHRSGEFAFTAEVFAQLMTNLGAASNGAIPVDYEHTSETMEGGVAQAGAPAVAWVTDLEVRADGRELWGLFAWVDPQAVEYVRAGRYRYLSPAIVFNARDRRSGKPIGAAMSSVALTNNPFLLGMTPLAATAHVPTDNEDSPMAESQNTAPADTALASELAAVKAERDKLAADHTALKSAHAKLETEQAASLKNEALETVAALSVAGVIEGDDAIDAAVDLYLTARATFAKLYGAKIAELRKPAGQAATLAARFPGLAGLATPLRASAEVAALLKTQTSAAPETKPTTGPVDTTVMPYGDAIEAVAANLRAKDKTMDLNTSYSEASRVLKSHGRTG